MHAKPGFKHRLFAQTARFLQLNPQVLHLAVVVVVPHRRLKLGPALLPQQLQTFVDGVIWLSLEELGQQADLEPWLTLLTDIMEIATIPAKDLRHTRAAQEWIAEGRIEGEARGRQEGEAVVTLRLLNLRCGSLSDATIARIQALQLEQLEALAEALLDFSGPADLAAWLAQHGG